MGDAQEDRACERGVEEGGIGRVFEGVARFISRG